MADNLKRLCLIRMIVLSALVVSLAMAYTYGLEMSYNVLGATLLALCIFGVLAWLRSLQAWPVTELEFLGHIVLDILGLALVLYLSGGASNPFVSYFLVPLSISAATLPWRYTWFVALLCMGIYSLLLVFHQPLEVLSPHHHGGGDQPNLHLLGMWANFGLSALLITWFVVRMANALRERDELLNQFREEDLRDEQIMAVATLAAGTAHELGTPLSTMQILVEELKAETRNNPQVNEDVELLGKQLDLCRATLKNLVETADRSKNGALSNYNASDFVNALIDDWRVMRPESAVECYQQDTVAKLTLVADTTLNQALINLLNNAADASSSPIILNVNGNSDELQIEILDDGPGLPEDIADQIGKPVMVESTDGLGIGLLLTHATIDRFNGEVTLSNRASGGTRTLVKLPVLESEFD